MDRRRRRAALLGAALLAAWAPAASRTGAPPLRALNWLAPGGDATQALTVAPTECLARPADPETALAVEVGRAAFRSTMLLGGQAARAGLSCESCHGSGRDNPRFLFPGVSGRPGTADVTSSLFSTRRGDDLDDPRPIPDLSGPKARLKVSQAPAAGALETFIRGLVTEEFDGPPPAPSVLAGLAAYVRALDPSRCPREASAPVTVASLMADARRAVSAAVLLARRGDGAGAAAMTAAARGRLGLIDERFAGPALAGQRRALRASDAQLAAAAQDLRVGRPKAAPALEKWLRRAPGLEAGLRRRERDSLFDPARLRAVIGRSLAPARSISILPGSAPGRSAPAAG